jgi:hypothetical protein
MRWNWHHTLLVVVFVVVYAGLAVIATQLDLSAHNRLGFWSFLVIAVLVLLLMMVVGEGIAGRIDGILVDSRNRVTLANFQLVIWTLVVVSALSAAFFTNLMANLDSSKVLDVTVPPELWLALGISGVTFAGAKGIGVLQGAGDPNTAIPSTHPDEQALTADGIRARGKLAVRAERDKATWGDMFVSDQLKDSMTVDIAKVQMFFFTVLLAFGYAAAVADDLLKAHAPDGITHLPNLNTAFVTLLAISQGTYLAGKVVKGT